MSRHEASRVSWFERPFKERLSRYDMDQLIQHISRDVHAILQRLQKETATPDRPLKPHEVSDWVIRHIDAVEKKLDLLIENVGRYERADRRRDEKMASTVQKKIDELKAKVGPMTDAIAALTAAWDAYTAALEEAKDDPEELQAVMDAYEAQKEQILTLALRGTTPPEPPPEPPAE